MRNGFSFLGKHSSEFGITMLTKSRPILPEKRTNTADFPSRDGSVEYAALNEFGRAMYQNRTFTLSLHMDAENITELQMKLSKAAVWLSGGKGDLIFDDMPGVRWIAEVKRAIDYVPELSGRQAVLDVDFDVEPFSEGLESAASSVMLDSDIILDSDVYLSGEALEYTMTLDEGQYFGLTVNNEGTAPVRPVITVSVPEGNYVGTFAICLGGHEIGFSEGAPPKDSVTINIDEYSATGNDGLDYSGALNGDLWELQPGENEITFKPGTKMDSSGAAVSSQTYTLTFDYTPKYLYNVSV